MIENYLILFAFIGVLSALLGFAALVHAFCEWLYRRKYHAQVMDKVICRY